MFEFSKILIANRGEIARRIMCTARKMGYICSVIYTSEEINSDFVVEADEAFDLGNGTIQETYLNIPKIIEIALQNKIHAIHPGFGFLSENYLFAKACEDHNLIFVGPTSDNIKLMSQKLEARKFAQSLDIPLLNSIQGNNIEEIIELSSFFKYPVIVKAVSGGGGKGMYIVRKKEELKEAINKAQRAAFDYFGDPDVYIEEYLESPRHIEVQILGDSHGNLVHLFERECTIQRRHQKIIEEAPAQNLSEHLRNNLLESALKIARKMGYVNAGTIEFLLDENQNFYFLEMNTRIQVEHPVTEEITGIDIVKEQFRIAAGKPLSFAQEDVLCSGHSIEGRIYAENPYSDFQPSAGTIVTYMEPTDPEVRIDSSINRSLEISANFDPMISKVISYDDNRENARIKLIKALKQYIIHGIDTNITYLIEILNHPDFIQNRFSTSFCKKSEKMLQSSYLKKMHEFSVELIAAAFLVFAFSFLVNLGISTDVRVWQSLGYWRNLMVTELNIFGNNHIIEFKKQQGDYFTFWVNDNGPVSVNGHSKDTRVDFLFSGQKHVAFISPMNDLYFINISGITFTIRRNDHIKNIQGKENERVANQQQSQVTTPITGKILKVNVKLNDVVNKGDVLMVVESMKMENYILAPRNGQITEIYFNIGDRVIGQDVLAILA